MYPFNVRRKVGRVKGVMHIDALTNTIYKAGRRNTGTGRLIKKVEVQDGPFSAACYGLLPE
jgi:hypothetical protein